MLLYTGLFCSAYNYFHQPSHVEVIAPSLPKNRISKFGYSIGYQSTTSTLFVGAPHSDLDGKVFSCPVTNDDLGKKTILCDDYGIDVSKLAKDYSRINSTEQNFCLGASMAVTAGYIFTCAPLWSAIFLDGSNDRFGPLGTCFVSNGTEYASRYFGLTEEYMNKNQSNFKKPHIYDVIGGVGWSTLADPDNNIIIIAMPQVVGSSFSFIKIDQPLEPAKLGLSSYHTVSLDSYYYLGLSMTAGVFFSGHSKLYAFSMMQSSRSSGEIAFLYYDKELDDIKLLEYRRNVLVRIVDEEINSMFGAALHSVNLDSDGYDELIVGAPAQTYSRGYDNGAVHFYLGGRTAKKPVDYIANLMIYSTKSLARFGSTIASVDLDNDFISDIFISAPYEETGVVYILAGYEVKQYLKREGNSKVPIASFKSMQRIINSNLRAMGISLQPIVSEFGNALAIGSLYDKVLLYRHIPSINVTVQASLKGKKIVRELDNAFTMTITVIVQYPPKPELITGDLLLSANIKGEGASIIDGNIKLKLNKNQTKYSTDVDVSLKGDQPGTYIFNVKMNEDIKNLDKPDFDKSLFTVNKFYGNPEYSEPVFRRCKDEECVPELSVHFLGWTGGDNDYILGSTEQENMTLVVHNSRNETYASCARVKITGAQFSIPECAQSNSGWHTCRILKIGRDEDFPIHVYFDMSQSTNRDKKLVVDVMLYNNCGTEVEKADGKNSTTITFNTPTASVFIDGLGYDRNVTQSEIDDDSTPYIEIRNTFTATNNGSFTWKSIPVVITIKKEPFLEDADISQSAFDCGKKRGGTLDITFTCNITVLSNSTTSIQTTVTIVKKKMLNNFKENKLNVTSSYKLYLEPTNEILEKSFATTVYLRKDSGFANNQNLVIFISVLVAIIVLAISTLIMYKGGFFKSKESQQLNELKEEIRKKSVRRPAETQDEEEMNVELGDENQIELEVLEHGIPLQESNVVNICDSEQLIEKEKC